MADKPLVEPHLGPAPDDLLIEDIIVGDGPEATAGQHAVVHYVGVGATSGEEFDASWNRDEPFDFDLGAGQVIKGWDEASWACASAVVVVSSFLRTSPTASVARAASSRPNETLIFVVDLLELR